MVIIITWIPTIQAKTIKKTIKGKTKALTTTTLKRTITEKIEA